MDLSIIIVNYCTYNLTKNTLTSLLNTIKKIDYEIIVVDNASIDNSLEKLIKDFGNNNRIQFIRSKTNGGFAYANNIGFNNSCGNYILLLNSDVVVKDKTINASLNYIIQHENIGALGCKVSLPDGSLDKACRRSFPTFKVSFYRMTGLSKLFPNSKHFNQYNLSYLDDNGIYPVDCIVGAYMLIPRDIFIECDGLDESYFMYGEDIELCYNIKELGYDVIYYGAHEIIHYKGGSGKNKKLLYAFHKSMAIFYDKHYKETDNFLINIITHLSIWTLYYLKLIISYL
ncbi:glycosyltransferase family 2 protein [Methanosphaera sp. WGK6]|uniref:glycosyltransferase family 2 protein n=1 Tax=Methanosphaera sp. WGK6 TaxID=1561964 RepID=UPI00084C1F95|nr:glycosyltransferase family 2 protein [Methanosphaera sp. WGK6]OED30274.1 glycosyl transferase family 2 [Methanosphaera sp. WGK6]